MKLNSLTLAGCLAVAMAAAPAISLAGTVGHESTFELLRDFQATAVDAANHAATLQSVTHDPNCDWQVHAQNLTVLKEDVNEMGRELTSLPLRSPRTCKCTGHIGSAT